MWFHCQSKVNSLKHLLIFGHNLFIHGLYYIVFNIFLYSQYKMGVNRVLEQECHPHAYALR